MFISLDALAKGKFMRGQRLILGCEILPSGERYDIVKVVMTKPEAEVTRESNLNVVWEFWRCAQSEYHRREIGVVDLGEIGD
jgi:hypothetical protein